MKKLNSFFIGNVAVFASGCYLKCIIDINGDNILDYKASIMQNHVKAFNDDKRYESPMSGAIIKRQKNFLPK